MQSPKIASEGDITIEGEEDDKQLNHRHYGATIPIGIRSDGEPKYLLGPHCNKFEYAVLVFFITLFVTTFILIYMIYDLTRNASDKKIQVGVITTLTTLYYIYSYFKVGFSNPGIASSGLTLSEELIKNQRYCTPCKIIRAPKVVHCYHCDLCIIGYDHHCPWVGKCIGSQNMKDFKLFLLSIMLLIISFAICVYLTAMSGKD